MDLGGDGGVLINDAETAVFPATAEGALGIIRVVGDAPLEDDVLMPVTLYISVYTDRAGAFVFMGDPEAVRVFESEILATVDSMQILE